ncbi:MAG TPA: CehA/McbA family metallohydrolase [bacterium]|nr:CehA/McbA family metallohydrolase [bacterium]
MNETDLNEGYWPIDLSSWCNQGPEAFAPGAGFPLGMQSFRGLPFQIGPSQGKGLSLLDFGPQGYREPVGIPIQRTARWVIIAHRLLESRIREGETAGRVIAHYVFQYENLPSEIIPIRERLEISEVPPDWGQWPLLAVPDQNDGLKPRYAGPWGAAGERQTEVVPAAPRWFVLWAWRNPHPEQILDWLRVEPRDRRFVIAAVTVSSLEESPLRREPRRPVILRLKDPEEAAEPFDLSVEADRGSVTYPYPLPTGSAEEFKQDSMAGWGQTYNTRTSPAYVEIAALPSATIRVARGEAVMEAVRWNDVLQKKQVETDRVRLELVERGKNWVHVTVLDDETGRPLPCRVHFRSPVGIPYAPHGHPGHLMSDQSTWHIDNGGDIRLGHVTYAYIDGACQGWLPRGEVIVDVARGFEYLPLRASVMIQPGQREMTLRLKRVLNMKRERWFSGDTHVHFLSTLGAQLEAQGEDVSVVNLLQSQWGHLFTNTEEFTGRPLYSADGGTVVYTSQENRQHILGHLSLLGLKHPVMPWCTGGPDEAEQGGTLETALSHWADACHQQGGTVIVPHIPNPNCELPALIAGGRADALEMTTHEMYAHIEYYRYLNAGYRLPLVGGTDRMTAEVPVGLYRTYVYIPPDEEFTYENWCRNLRLGRTFLSGGPILRFTVNGRMVGDTLALPGNGGTLEAVAEVDSIFPVHSLEIVQEGRVVASTEESRGARRLQLKAQLKVEHHTWLAARAGGPGFARALSHHDAWRRGIMAHTSPVYVSVGGEWWMHDEETAQYMMTLIHGGLEYIRNHSGQYPRGSVTHHHGEDDHLDYLERPFREALERIQARRRRYGI